EWVHVQLHQQKGMISLSPPTICNSAWPGKELPPPGEMAAQPEMSLFALCLAGPQRLAGLQLLC
ncbi:hypothetical protein, partial [Klebsiella pneumoniae]|uniref:hypothetical protein n=1 Tax=Klebsiella pneumoniae TaxID=573 RepID=UPI000964739B